MQAVGSEMNLSETAFLVPTEDGWSLRWFTPTVEVALCGHATLASAHVLWESGLLATDTVARFHTKSGLLTARLVDGWIELDFPSRPATALPAADALEAALAVSPRWVGANEDDYLIELESEDAVVSLRPNLDRVEKLPVRGVCVTARASRPDTDFVSRFFAPAVGIPEDPVTGSAHCALAPFWAERLGRPELVGYQASRRGGVIRVTNAGERVRIAGRAVTPLRGELLV